MYKVVNKKKLYNLSIAKHIRSEFKFNKTLIARTTDELFIVSNFALLITLVFSENYPA